MHMFLLLHGFLKSMHSYQYAKIHRKYMNTGIPGSRPKSLFFSDVGLKVGYCGSKIRVAPPYRARFPATNLGPPGTWIQVPGRSCRYLN